MCYDISFSTTIEMVTDYIPGIIVDPQININFEMNVHVQAQAFKKYPVVINEEGVYKLKLLEWGIIPEYMNTPEKIKKGRNSMCNARSEKIIEDKRSYWHRIRNKRCLIPVTGIFEHREVKSWKNKVPYFIQLKNRALFCLPGLYHYPFQNANPETGEITGTYTVVTRAANEVMKFIHNGGENAFRMPLFLPKELEMKWLQPNLSDIELQTLLDFEMPSDELSYHPVYTIRTTKERPDYKGKLDPFDWNDLPPLGKDTNEISLF
jgi:putative SOS response-associated peptidase YedK